MTTPQVLLHSILIKVKKIIKLNLDRETNRNRFNRLMHPTSSSIVSFLNQLVESTSSETEDREMENIIQYLMNNDPNKYGNPPTAKETLDKLEDRSIDEEELLDLRKKDSIDCSVCRDEFVIESKLVKLPCNHYFHGECVKPWLEQRNSCPTCRFELPTDDTEYEIRKAERGNSNA
jgi:hypothetical protein